ncbi:MAG: LysR family transcriptional regulator [Proteobacteria bacterium]|nr:LysR family transcriptional regulator [Pseudomonadota bacterium]
MKEEVGWELLRSFLGVMQHGSLSGAARALGITQPTVGRHVHALERSLGLTLFTRSRTGLLPTEGALELHPYAAGMRSTAEALRRAASSLGSGVRGTVRISASEVMGMEVLPPMLTSLRQSHGELRIELVMTNRVQDLLQREADIAVRMAAPRQEALVARHVGAAVVGLYAHREYLARHPAPQSPAELQRHALIGFDTDTPFLRSARRAFPQWNRAAFAMRTDSDVGQMALLRAGCGIGACQAALASRDPNLIRVLPRAFRYELDTWVTMHEDLRSSSRCTVTFHHLVRELTAYLSVRGARP